MATVGVVNTYRDSTLTNGMTYYFKVRAVNHVGAGLFSEERAVTPITSPSAPTLTLDVVGNATVSFSWTAPTDAGGAPVGSYNIYRSASGGPDTLLVNINATITSYEDDTAANGIVYVYKVAAVNEAGEGARSNGVTAAPATIPSPPVLRPRQPATAASP